MTIQTSKNRIVFSEMVDLLMAYMRLKGFYPSYSWTIRKPGCPKYKKGTYHEYGLAVDINLYDKDGNYLDRTEDHAPFGQFWEFIGGTWGGSWNDGNHYSYLEGRR